MSNYPISSEENYKAICIEMKQLAEELEKNSNMSESEFHKILDRHGKLGKKLEQYGQMTWKKL